MAELQNALLGAFAASEMMDMADRQAHGELHILISEQIFNIDDDVEISDALLALNKDAVINAAVEKFRERFAEILDKCFEYHIEEDEE